MRLELAARMADVYVIKANGACARDSCVDWIWMDQFSCEVDGIAGNRR